MDCKALTEALIKAKEAARATGENIDDGGTCNFDNPAMVFDRKKEPKRKRLSPTRDFTLTSGTLQATKSRSRW